MVWESRRRPQLPTPYFYHFILYFSRENKKNREQKQRIGKLHTRLVRTPNIEIGGSRVFSSNLITDIVEIERVWRISRLSGN